MAVEGGPVPSTWRGIQIYGMSDIAVGALGWMLQVGGEEAACSLTLQYHTEGLRPREGRGAPAAALLRSGQPCSVTVGLLESLPRLGWALRAALTRPLLSGV